MRGLKNLNGLGAVTKLGSDLVVKDAPLLESLYGLDSLRKVGAAT